MSAAGRRVHGGFQLNPWEAARIADVGDVPFPRANDNEDCIEQITGGEPVCFLHFDAHKDVFTKVDHFLMVKKSAAHWGAYLADQGKVDPTHSMQIGLRGHPRTLD